MNDLFFGTAAALFVMSGKASKKRVFVETHETNCIKHFDQAGLNLIQIWALLEILNPF